MTYENVEKTMPYQSESELELKAEEGSILTCPHASVCKDRSI